MIEEFKKNNNNKKENIFNSTYHTLFLKDIAPNAVPKSGTTDDEEYFKIVNPYTHYDLYLGTFAEKDRGGHELFYTLRQAGDEDTLDIRIYSHGGSIEEGKQLQNIINEYFPGRTRTILDAAGYSMGAFAFCMGNERIIFENSTLMFHDYSHMVGGKGGEIESQVIHNSQSIRDFIYSTIVPYGYITDDEFKKMLDGKDFWMDAVEICERGIATHIIINGFKICSELYVRYVDENITYEEMTTGIINEKNKKKKTSKKKTSKKKISVPKPKPKPKKD